jgi:hypothetical protein
MEVGEECAVDLGQVMTVSNYLGVCHEEFSDIRGNRVGDHVRVHRPGNRTVPSQQAAEQSATQSKQFRLGPELLTLDAEPFTFGAIASVRAEQPSGDTVLPFHTEQPAADAFVSARAEQLSLDAVLPLGAEQRPTSASGSVRAEQFPLDAFLPLCAEQGPSGADAAIDILAAGNEICAADAARPTAEFVAAGYEVRATDPARHSAIPTTGILAAEHEVCTT